MKTLKYIFLMLSFTLCLNAQISQQTYNYLSNDNFAKARISIENDLKQDQFDAKAWYFYSRILYELNYPNAAKKALDNALNIDNSASFVKGGKQALLSFGGDILYEIDKNPNEAKINIPLIERKSSQNNSYQSSNSQNYQNSKQAQNSSSTFSFFIIFALLALGIFILIKATKKPKVVLNPQFNQDELLYKINSLSNDVDDLLKNVELINKNTKLYQELFALNKDILLLSRNASLNPSLAIKKDYEKYKAKFKILEDFSYKKDYDLSNYKEKLKDLANLESKEYFKTNKQDNLYNKEIFGQNQNNYANNYANNSYQAKPKASFLPTILRILEFVFKIIFMVLMTKNNSRSSRDYRNSDYNNSRNSRNSNDDFWSQARNSRNSNDDFWSSARNSGSSKGSKSDKW